MQTYRELAEIISREQVAEDIYRLTFKAPDIAAAARPGQFVMVRFGDGQKGLMAAEIQPMELLVNSAPVLTLVDPTSE